MQVEDETFSALSRLDSLLEDAVSYLGVSSERPEVARVFYCYARVDESLRKELDDHLSALKLDGKVTTWCDREILPGTNWEQEIEVHLNDADLILLLVSPAFLASGYCQGKEMALALERYRSHEACIIPVLLRPVDLPVKLQDTPLREFQLLPKDGQPVTQWSDRDLAFKNIAQGIGDVVDRLIAKIREQEQHRREFPQKLQEIRESLIKAHQAELEQVREEIKEREQVSRDLLVQKHQINMEQVYKAHQVQLERVSRDAASNEQAYRQARQAELEQIRKETEKREQTCRDQLEAYRIELNRVHQAYQTEQGRARDLEKKVQALEKERGRVRKGEKLIDKAEEYLQRERARMDIEKAFILFRRAVQRGLISQIVVKYNPILDGSELVTPDEWKILSLARKFIQAYNSENDMALLAAKKAIDDSLHRDLLCYTQEELNRINLAMSRASVKEENDKGCSGFLWFILNLLPSIGLGFLLHVWWASLICIAGEVLLFCLAIPIAIWLEEIEKWRTGMFVMALSLGITWGFVSWFLDSLFSTKIHFLYLPQSLAAIGFLFGLIINFLWIASFS